MQSVSTTYLPATNHRGSRIKVKASGRKDSVIVSWDDALDVEPNHAAALRAALLKWGEGWTSHAWVGGDAKRGMVWVCVADHATRVEVAS